MENIFFVEGDDLEKIHTIIARVLHNPDRTPDDLKIASDGRVVTLLTDVAEDRIERQVEVQISNHPMRVIPSLEPEDRLMVHIEREGGKSHPAMFCVSWEDAKRAEMKALTRYVGPLFEATTHVRVS